MKGWSKLLIVVALIGAVVFVVEHKKRQGFVCAGGICMLPTDETSAGPVADETPTKKPLPKLLDLGAGHCVPCKMMKPILDELQTGFAEQFETVYIDIAENRPAAREYGVRVIPTQIFFDADGNELFRHEGFMAKEDLLAKWQELGFDFSNE
jgi:thiol-disulfide isomerase/thioredoxin